MWLDTDMQPAAHLAGCGPLALWQLRGAQRVVAGPLPGPWQQIQHPEYALSVAEMLEHEQPQRMPMVSAFDGYVEEPGRVSSTCLVSVARNHYSVPCELA
jgi:hypothetical protein